MNNLEKRLFQALIFLLPTQLALHFWPNWAYVFGIRVDYLAPAIYLTDILVLGLVVFRILQKDLKFNFPIVLAVSLFVLLNILGAHARPPALFKWLKIFEMAALVIFVKNNKNIKIADWIVKPLTFSLILFSAIGIVQFFLGKTIGGPLYFLGERTFTLATPGIATTQFLGREVLRAYSTFSHPNSLAGYLLVAGSLIFLFGRTLLQKTLTKIAILLAGICLFLTFSKTALVAGAGLAVLFLIYKKWPARFGSFAYLLLISSLAFSLLQPIVVKSWNIQPETSNESVFNRIMLAETAEKMFAHRPVVGVGLNNFIINLPRFVSLPKVAWWLQPVHNIFLLALSEGGVAGMLLGVIILIKSLTNSGKTALLILVIILTGLADHYWLTLQQNQLLFSIVLGLSLRNKQR